MNPQKKIFIAIRNPQLAALVRQRTNAIESYAKGLERVLETDVVSDELLLTGLTLAEGPIDADKLALQTPAEWLWTAANTRAVLLERLRNPLCRAEVVIQHPGYAYTSGDTAVRIVITDPHVASLYMPLGDTPPVTRALEMLRNCKLTPQQLMHAFQIETRQGVRNSRDTLAQAGYTESTVEQGLIALLESGQVIDIRVILDTAQLPQAPQQPPTPCAHGTPKVRLHIRLLGTAAEKLRTHLGSKEHYSFRARLQPQALIRGFKQLYAQGAFTEQELVQELLLAGVREDRIAPFGTAQQNNIETSEALKRFLERHLIDLVEVSWDTDAHKQPKKDDTMNDKDTMYLISFTQPVLYDVLERITQEQPFIKTLGGAFIEALRQRRLFPSTLMQHTVLTDSATGQRRSPAHFGWNENTIGEQLSAMIISYRAHFTPLKEEKDTSMNQEQTSPSIAWPTLRGGELGPVALALPQGPVYLYHGGFLPVDPRHAAWLGYRTPRGLPLGAPFQQPGGIPHVSILDMVGQIREVPMPQLPAHWSAEAVRLAVRQLCASDAQLRQAEQHEPYPFGRLPIGPAPLPGMFQPAQVPSHQLYGSQPMLQPGLMMPPAMMPVVPHGAQPGQTILTPQGPMEVGRLPNGQLGVAPRQSVQGGAMYQPYPPMMQREPQGPVGGIYNGADQGRTPRPDAQGENWTPGGVNRPQPLSAEEQQDYLVRVKSVQADFEQTAKQHDLTLSKAQGEIDLALNKAQAVHKEASQMLQQVTAEREKLEALRDELKALQPKPAVKRARTKPAAK